MTEEEAKTKWCPMRRLTEIGHVRITNVDPGIHTLNCIGSACMMWRTDPFAKGMHVTAEGAWPEPPDGYCGLAGKVGKP